MIQDIQIVHEDEMDWKGEVFGFIIQYRYRENMYVSYYYRATHPIDLKAAEKECYTDRSFIRFTFKTFDGGYGAPSRLHNKTKEMILKELDAFVESHSKYRLLFLFN
jgi:hypothetical protein